ncbi:MAG TPA: hypothetical protein VKQ34_03520 [Candidatus Saccharimonadales bacterium]|nr:hypothetical protein [Candidatus Saccharimonadales bacterium]
MEIVRDVHVIGHLQRVGQGNIGRGRQLELVDKQHNAEVAAARAIRPCTNRRVAYCIDERAIIRLGDITNPNVLRDIVVPQLPGGTVLAATKAAVAANIGLVRDAADFKEAYLRVRGVLTNAGYFDAGHDDCGASKQAGTSVEQPVAAGIVAENLHSLGVWRPEDERRLAQQMKQKAGLADRGYFASWSPEVHRELLMKSSPEHFSFLAVDDNDHVTHGHLASGALILGEEDDGFAKNAFTEDTGLQLFAHSDWFARELSGVLGVGEEVPALELAFRADLLDVGNRLFAPENSSLTVENPNYYPGMALLAVA